MGGRRSHNFESVAEVTSEGFTDPVGYLVGSARELVTLLPPMGTKLESLHPPGSNFLGSQPPCPSCRDLAFLLARSVPLWGWGMRRCSAEGDERLRALRRRVEKLRDGKGRGTQMRGGSQSVE